MNRVSILGVQFDAITKAEAVTRAMARIREGKKGYVVTPNSEIVYMARSDAQLKKLLNAAALVLPDGIGVIHAAKILKKPITEKVAGIEFAASLMEAMAKEGRSLFLFGAKPGVAEQAAENLKKKYPGLIVTGCRNGYFKDDAEAVRDINAAGHSDVILVCLGAPKQEIFMEKHIDELNGTLLCGLGGSLDVYAGIVERAPDFYVNHGLEWFYRLKKEPWRAKRMTALPKFLLTVMKSKVTGEDK
ncbi:WecB/TagA/CpsF family glycosyltransferase [Butyricicoccus sp.]|uniref:WecB/TagA/CpsF family glycosyltransferase n=1 Tax=Butyricicoccus sp. TaxID=2049021 RepID=UPI0037370211